MVFSDLVTFIDREARIATNLIFGNISGNTQSFSDSRSRRPSQSSVDFRPSKWKTSTFATQVLANQTTNSVLKPCADLVSPKVQSIVCSFCQQSHSLEDCNLLRWKPYQEHIKFLSKRLCSGCLSNKHVARVCHQRKICKIPTELISILQFFTHQVIVRSPQECPSSLIHGEARLRTAMAIIPVKIHSKSTATSRSLHNYVFLDHGSSATFCRESLMRKPRLLLWKRKTAQLKVSS